MDYEKAYKELIWKLRTARNGEISADDRFCVVIDSIVPGLEDSEDERIRKNILALVKKHAVNHERCQMETYLEKLKEKKPVTIVRIPKFRVGDIIQHVPLEKWDRSNKITSIDENGYTYDLSHLGDTVSGGAIGFAFEDEYELVEQKPAEWSEEDEKVWKALLRCCDDWDKGQFGCMKKEDVASIRAYLEKLKEQKPGLEKANDLRTWLNIVSKVLTEFQGIGQYLDNPICQEIANMLREKYCFDDASSDWDRVYRKGLDAGEIYGYNKAKKEQKPLSTEETELNSIAFLEQLGYTCVPPGAEQKPAGWSDKDEKMLKETLALIETIEDMNKAKDGFLDVKIWLKSLPERFNLQTKQEWSEGYNEENIQTRFAFYTYKDDPSTLYLSNVFVEEASRNHGFGTRILRAAEKVAETLGATTISLKVKRDSHANDWYRKNGYGYVTFEGQYDWREKNLEYLKPKKEVEWSEEDKKILDSLIRLYSKEYSAKAWPWANGAITYGDVVNFLKSLRPQPHWKPSEDEDSKNSK